MPQFNNILYDLAAPGVLKVTLNRPDSLNSFTGEMLLEMAEAFKQAKAAEDIRVVLVTGAGRAFCAGQDLKAAGTDLDFEKTLKTTYRPMITALADLGKPSIAVVNGVAAGAGMSLTLGCDFRLASQKAKFVTAFSRIALVPDCGMSYHLPRLVGLGRAQEMISLNRDLSAEEALNWGLVTQVAAPEELESASLALAERLVNTPTLAFGLTRQMLHRAFALTLDEALAQEEKNQAKAGSSEDFFEGVAAFTEKRAPVFKGR